MHLAVHLKMYFFKINVQAEMVLFWLLCFCKNQTRRLLVWAFVLVSPDGLIPSMTTKQIQESDEIHFNVSTVSNACVCEVCFVLWRSVSNKGSLQLCPPRPAGTDHRRAPHVLSLPGCEWCVCGGQVGFSEPVEWSGCWQQAGHWKRERKEKKSDCLCGCLSLYSQQVNWHYLDSNNKLIFEEKTRNPTKTKASVTEWIRWNSLCPHRLSIW